MTASVRRSRAVRDQDASPFNVILQELLDVLPFARAAAVFDFEGETVDYAGNLDPYDLRVIAATFQIVMTDLRELAITTGLRGVLMNLTTSSYQIRVLDSHYSLIIVLRTLATHCVSDRLVTEVADRLAVEAGLQRAAKPTWHRVEVLTSAKRRPVAVREPGKNSAWITTEILGAHPIESTGERGYRVHVRTGIEVNLVSERNGLWFVDEPLDIALHGEAPDARQRLFPRK